MPYPEFFVAPMREELTSLGIQELRTPADVDQAIANSTGTVMVVVNSVCGCAAGMARPGVRLALQGSTKPDRVASVFAGQDLEATARARGYFADVPPSSPSLFLFKEGKLVHVVPRHRIEGRDAAGVASDLRAAFEKFCAVPA